MNKEITTLQYFSDEWIVASYRKTGGSKSPNNQLHHQNDAHVCFDGSNCVAEGTQCNVLRDENFGQQLIENEAGETNVDQVVGKDAHEKCTATNISPYVTISKE